MPEFLVRPTMKFVKLSYCFWLGAGAGMAIYNWGYRPAPRPGFEFLLALPALAILWTAARHIARHFVTLTIDAGRLRYEAGILSKSTRTLEVSKVQDVRVEQSMGQRMFGVGSLSLETAGETSKLTIADIDRPQEIAEKILDAAHRAVAGGAPPRAQQAPSTGGA
jgi:uncharacterized membrane protein YdbT with pleckstrin-like domain